MKKCNAEYVKKRGGNRELTNYTNQRKLANAIRKYFYSQFEDYELRGCGVYGIRNKINNDMYIGSTGVTFKLRLSQHVADLTSLNHSNKYLLEAWQNYNYDDFEFVILEKASSTDSREDIFVKESKFIKEYINNNQRLYNVDMNKKSYELKRDYIMRLKEENSRLTDDMKNYFKKLLGNTFYDSMIDSVIMEDILNSDYVDEDSLSDGIEHITEHEYNGIKHFLGNAENHIDINETWEYDNLDMCHCSIVKCLYYDSYSHRCKMYDTDLSEQWTKPRCGYYDVFAGDELYYNDMAYRIHTKEADIRR